MIPQHSADIANEIRMLRSQYRGSFLVVEGQDDYRFMRNFASHETCKIIIAQGKQNVCEVIDILERDSFIGVLGLIDADFDRIEGKKNTSLNIVMPEYHDLDALLIYSPALDRVLAEFGSEGKLDTFGKDVMTELADRASQLAYLRLHSLRNELGLRFRDMNYSAWIDARSFQADADKLIQAISNRSQRHDLSSHNLRAEMQIIERSNYDFREMCNGADLIGILSVGLRRVLGTDKAASVGAENLRRSLRLAYSEQHFVKSNLWMDIKVWETRVAVFSVLRL